jgi:hypothetical protein
MEDVDKQDIPLFCGINYLSVPPDRNHFPRFGYWGPDIQVSIVPGGVGLVGAEYRFARLDLGLRPSGNRQAAGSRGSGAGGRRP